MEVFRAALRCVYFTLKFTRIHTTNIKDSQIVAVFHLILDSNQISSQIPEKLKLLALQTVRELTQTGFHMMLDPPLISMLMRYL